MGWRARIGTVMCALVIGGIAAAPASARRTLTFHEQFSVTPYVGVLTGDRYTLFSTSVQGEVGVVLDELTGRQTTVWLPADCPAPEGGPTLGGSWLLEDCTSSRLDLYSLAGGNWQPVTVAQGCQQLNRSQTSRCLIDAVGDDWIEYDLSTTRSGDRFVFQNIATGAVQRDPTNATTVADPNSPVLAQRLCSPLRVPRYGQLSFDGRFAIADEPDGTMFLERCGTRRRVPLSGGIDIPIYGWERLNTPAIVWPTRPGLALGGIFLSSLHEFRVIETPPRHVSRFAILDGHLSFSDRHVYVEIAPTSPTGRFRVMSAPLPTDRP